MKLDTFLNLPTEEVAELVREAGPKVCVFPINGTRRWFMLEYPELAQEDYVENYLRVSGRRHVELYRLIFEHGIDTLVTPIFGPELLKRGEFYQALLEPGLTWFAENETFTGFYDAHDVRVRVYGDAERYLRGGRYAEALTAYEDLARRTRPHQKHRLFFGVCAHDPSESIARFGAQFQHEQNRVPTRREIIEAYYGEYVEAVDFFIGFDRPAAFDMPLIARGTEDLYYTVNPSPYLDAETLRLILHDHLYARQIDDADYKTVSSETWEAMADLYRLNRRRVLGLGRQHRSGFFWYPVPQVTLPSSLEEGTGHCRGVQSGKAAELRHLKDG